ncbi:hypothetical protein NEIELOOT_01931 [Neisseria elongata subsp. glycolytica ATCC 29315]|uniref:Uncharacterized protein n=1 Tax=Neisseria elongata subsp. glycolytica ATCC 29315 TaxID=546263 RepID=D4DS87_NEIEG|nr:hypothetical protein NEIELOOT_01931 [Neisseria elongata subsp. glycolytica ATCC 29315]
MIRIIGFQTASSRHRLPENRISMPSKHETATKCQTSHLAIPTNPVRRYNPRAAHPIQTQPKTSA